MAFRAWLEPYLWWLQVIWSVAVMTLVTCYGIHYGWEAGGLKAALGYGLLAFIISPLLTSPSILVCLF